MSRAGVEEGALPATIALMGGRLKKSLKTNIALVENNARLAARIAKAL
jgi:pseudouridine-5'-phosphate glycosidase